MTLDYQALVLIAFLFGAIALAGLGWGLKVPVMAYGSVALFLVAGFYLFSFSAGAWDIWYLGGWMSVGLSISIGMAAMQLYSKEEEKSMQEAAAKTKAEEEEAVKKGEAKKKRYTGRRPFWRRL
jgi:mannose/fructose/N-acetylgalactosamine-specific phosphotransferase system component IIC